MTRSTGNTQFCEVLCDSGAVRPAVRRAPATVACRAVAVAVAVAVCAGIVPLCAAQSLRSPAQRQTQELYRWVPQQWSSCSYGEVFPDRRSRVVACRATRNNQAVSDDLCATMDKPATSRNCTMEPLKVYDFELGTDDKDLANLLVEIVHPDVVGDAQESNQISEDWKYQNGPVDSYPATGPQFDHTYGNSSGHYYYVETSFPSGDGEVWMDSVLIRAEDVTLGECAVSFYLSGNGNARHLRVMEVALVAGNDSTPTHSLLWIDARTSDQYPSSGWHQQTVTIPTDVVGDFRLRWSHHRPPNAHTAPSGDWAVDDIQFSDACVPPSPTPTPTATPSPTASASRTPSRTPSPTASPSSTATPSSTQTPSPTHSPSSSSSGTATHSPTASSTPSHSHTPSGSPSHSVSPSASASPSSSHTRSPSSSASPSGSPSSTASPSSSSSRTVTPSHTASLSASASVTATMTTTPSQTPTHTRTPTSTRTPSVTTGLSHTATSTISESPSSTPSPTASASSTPSRTRTPSPTPSTTSTASSTASASPSPTASRTSSRSPSSSSTQSSTASPSPSPSSSPSRTVSPSQTSSPSPSPSFTASVSPTSSISRSATSTRTPSHSRGASPSGSPTPSRTPSATRTATPSNTHHPSTSSSATPSATASVSSSAVVVIDGGERVTGVSPPWIAQPLSIAAIAGGVLLVCFVCCCCGFVVAGRQRKADERKGKELEAVVVGSSKMVFRDDGSDSSGGPGDQDAGQQPNEGQDRHDVVDVAAQTSASLDQAPQLPPPQLPPPQLPPPASRGVLGRMADHVVRGSPKLTIALSKFRRSMSPRQLGPDMDEVAQLVAYAAGDLDQVVDLEAGAGAGAGGGAAAVAAAAQSGAGTGIGASKEDGLRPPRATHVGTTAMTPELRPVGSRPHTSRSLARSPQALFIDAGSTYASPPLEAQRAGDATSPVDRPDTNLTTVTHPTPTGVPELSSEWILPEDVEDATADAAQHGAGAASGTGAAASGEPGEHSDTMRSSAYLVSEAVAEEANNDAAGAPGALTRRIVLNLPPNAGSPARHGQGRRRPRRSPSVPAGAGGSPSPFRLAPPPSPARTRASRTPGAGGKADEPRAACPPMPVRRDSDVASTDADAGGLDTLETFFAPSPQVQPTSAAASPAGPDVPELPSAAADASAVPVERVRVRLFQDSHRPAEGDADPDLVVEELTGSLGVSSPSANGIEMKDMRPPARHPRGPR